jgi:uroporphyrinogen-III synthase
LTSTPPKAPIARQADERAGPPSGQERRQRHLAAAADRVLVLRGRALTVDDQEVLLGPSALALLRRLAATDAVVSKRELLACMPEGGDEHALEVAVSRLRRSLGSPGLVSTVVKRGYRLNAARDTRAGGGLERDVE